MTEANRGRTRITPRPNMKHEEAMDLNSDSIECIPFQIIPKKWGSDFKIQHTLDSLLKITNNMLSR